jgi:5-methylthioadenosine/S-adenosylhomocysteine deaminase
MLPSMHGCAVCLAAAEHALDAGHGVHLRRPARRAHERPRGRGAPLGDRGRPVVVQPSWVLTLQDDELTVLPDRDVVVRDGLIQEVRERRPGRDERLDAYGQVLLPGFISGHTHVAAASATRGYIESNPPVSTYGLTERPARPFLRAMELMEELDDDELDALTAYNLAEILRGGATTQVEMSLSLRQARSYVRVAARYGVRGYPAGMVPAMRRLMPIWKRDDDRVLLDSVPATLAEIQEGLAWARTANGAEDGRIRPMMAAAVSLVHTAETLTALRAAAEELGNGLHIHVQAGWPGGPGADDPVVRMWGKPEVPWLDEIGFLDAGVNVFGAHLLGIDLARDLPILARENFTFVNCPSGAGAGVLPGQWPYPEALAAGVNSSIGLDTHSNDYLENVKLAVFFGRARTDFLHPTSPVPMLRPSIWTAVESGTLAGARGLGRDDLGRIVPGARADLCTVDVTGLLVGSGIPPLEPLNHLLYAHGLAVRHVMTDGNLQVRDGRLLVDDEARLAERGGAVVATLWKRLAEDGFFVPMPRSDFYPSAG